MKKGTILFLIVICIMTVAFIGCPKTDPGATGLTSAYVKSLQYSVFDTPGYTPIYSNTISDAAHIKVGEWLTFTMPINVASIGYNGFGTDATGWTSMDKFRIQIITTNPSEEVLVYIDNVVVTNTTLTPLNLSFDSAPAGGSYLSKGTALGDNTTLTTIASQTCFTFHATSITANGSTGVEIQWDLQGAPIDMSSEAYTITFNYYIAAVY